MEKALQYGLSIAAELVGEPEPSLHRMHEFIQIRRQAWHAVCSRVRFGCGPTRCSGLKASARCSAVRTVSAMRMRRGRRTEHRWLGLGARRMSGDCGLRNACRPMRHFVAEVLAQCNVLQHSTPLLQRSAAQCVQVYASFAAEVLAQVTYEYHRNHAHRPSHAGPPPVQLLRRMMRHVDDDLQLCLSKYKQRQGAPGARRIPEPSAVRARAGACACGCVRACVLLCVLASVRASVRACFCACVLLCVRARVLLCVPVRVRTTRSRARRRVCARANRYSRLRAPTRPAGLAAQIITARVNRAGRTAAPTRWPHRSPNPLPPQMRSCSRRSKRWRARTSSWRPRCTARRQRHWPPQWLPQ